MMTDLSQRPHYMRENSDIVEIFCIRKCPLTIRWCLFLLTRLKCRYLDNFPATISLDP